MGSSASIESTALAERVLNRLSRYGVTHRRRGSPIGKHAPCSQMRSASVYKAVKPDREQGTIGKLQWSNDELPYR